MCFRLQAYPRPHLIFYKIQQNGTLWGISVPLSELSTFLAQGQDLGHYGFSSDNGPMLTASYLVACPALAVKEVVMGQDRACDLCYDLHSESDSYAFVEDYLGWTVVQYGDPETIA
jgi:hypothetical protein